MRKIILTLFLASVLLSCKEDNDFSKNIEVSKTYLELDNVNSREDVLIKYGSGSYYANSTDENVAKAVVNNDTLSVIGYSVGKCTIYVFDELDNVKSISVCITEPIDFTYYVIENIYIKKGEKRTFSFSPLNYKDYNTFVVSNKEIADVSVVGDKVKSFLVDAKETGKTTVSIFKGKMKISEFDINVVDKYDLYVPKKSLTLKIPFTYGINGISIWRGSGKYSATIENENIAKVESIINWNGNTFNQMCNDAAVLITPLNEGETFLNIKDEITWQFVRCKITVTR
jgi:hypothetical protein